MAIAADIVSWICLVAGSFFSIVGGLGLLRLPDFYTRIHGGAVTDTFGAGLVLTGLMFQAGNPLVVVKLVMILFFLLVTSPTSAHALSKSARAHGVEPLLVDDDGGEASREG